MNRIARESGVLRTQVAREHLRVAAAVGDGAEHELERVGRVPGEEGALGVERLGEVPWMTPQGTFVMSPDFTTTGAVEWFATDGWRKHLEWAVCDTIIVRYQTTLGADELKSIRGLKLSFADAPLAEE